MKEDQERFSYIKPILDALGELGEGQEFRVTPTDEKELKQIKQQYYAWGRKNLGQRSLYRLSTRGGYLTFERKRNKPAYQTEMNPRERIDTLLSELFILDEDKVEDKIESWLEEEAITPTDAAYIRAKFKQVMER